MQSREVSRGEWLQEAAARSAPRRRIGGAFVPYNSSRPAKKREREERRSSPSPGSGGPSSRPWSGGGGSSRGGGASGPRGGTSSPSGGGAGPRGGGAGPSSAAAAGELAKGETARYSKPGGEPVDVTVVAVHRDDPDGVYYTVRFAAGNERETVASNLQRAAGRSADRPPAKRARVEAEEPAVREVEGPVRVPASFYAAAAAAGSAAPPRHRAAQPRHEFQPRAGADDGWSVAGLTGLCTELGASVAREAVAWCRRQRIGDVRELASMPLARAFLSGISSLKRGGHKESVLRRRLAALEQAK